MDSMISVITGPCAMDTPEAWVANDPPRASNFEDVIERHRCEARSGSGQRCQLYREHREAHAYAWREKGAHPHVRGRPLPPFHVLRWDASGEWSCDGVEERLPWCAMECD